jgi:tRNA pseudouridine38-40 synthase
VRVLRLDLEYDGTHFAGFQVQPGARTVQGVIESALADLLGRPVRVVAAGRTDAGCHARGQVVSLACDTALPAERVAAALNARLPEDARVARASDPPPGFHARRSARARRYSYRLLDAPSVLLRRVAWWPRRPARGTDLERTVRPLAGEHDFASFQSTGSTETTTRCRVHRAEWRRWEWGWMLEVTADHFLYRMVRTLVGTSLVLQDDADPERAMQEILAVRDRRRAGPTAPARGLCLEQVYYEEDLLQ